MKKRQFRHFDRSVILRGLRLGYVGFTLAVSIMPCSRLAAEDFDRPPVRYAASTPANAVSRLEQRIASGQAHLKHEEHFGYLRSLLRELKIPESSQSLVFSKTSLQRDLIAPATPRALYFNDDAYVGICQGGPVMEVSAVDSQLGTVFYTLDQTDAKQPKFTRQTDNCLICHGSSQTHDIPGHLVRSVFPDAGGFPLLAEGTYRVNHSTPLEQRWGGWYVTGRTAQRHLGNHTYRPRNAHDELNQSLNLTDLGRYFRTSDYLTGQSDVVALMVLEHQTEAHNLITRANFLTRVALDHEAMLNREMGERPDHQWDSTASRIRDAGDPLVEYLLFSEEAPLTGPIRGTTSFADEFSARGPQDGQGRSLRDFDLEHRLFKYPCSYLIDSASFSALPEPVRYYVLRRIWEVLTSRDTSQQFAHLTATDRAAILEILRATKPDLPDYWCETTASGNGRGESAD